MFKYQLLKVFIVIRESWDQALEAENTDKNLAYSIYLKHMISLNSTERIEKPEDRKEDVVRNNPHMLHQESITLNNRKRQYYTKREGVRWGRRANLNE